MRSVVRALLVACTAVAFAVFPAAVAPAHQGNPNFLSQVRSLSPPVPGLAVDVLNRDDRLLLRNTSGRTVVIEGYADEPYARVRADGTVEVNTNSEAYYLNQDRFAQVQIPKGVDSDAPPVWKRLSKTGRFEWHDHRMHYMGKGTPKQVTDSEVRKKVFDWQIPLAVNGSKGAINGRLLWTPLPAEMLPLGAIFAFAALVIVLCIVVIVVRRRRSDAAPAEAVEAW